MPQPIRIWFMLAGRVLAGLFYLTMAFNHFSQLEGMAAYAAAQGVPLPEVGVIASGVLLAVAGLSFLFGWRPMLGIAALILFFVPVNLWMHDFWNMEGEAAAREMIGFLKNTALLGTSLMLAGLEEPWPRSVDARRL